MKTNIQSHTLNDNAEQILVYLISTQNKELSLALDPNTMIITSQERESLVCDIMKVIFKYLNKN